jgi:hypothetical protein
VTTYSKLLDWNGRTAVILASGPSMASTVPTRSSEHRYIVTNTTFRLVPWADVVYGCDFLWWKTHAAEVKRVAPEMMCWTQDKASAERYGVNLVRNEALPGSSLTGLRVNGNSGAGAINLAVLFGARKIILLGFDMREGPSGEKHWHADHPSPCVQKQLFGEWIFKYEAVAKDLKALGVEVVNATPRSALKCFPVSEEVAC